MSIPGSAGPMQYIDPSLHSTHFPGAEAPSYEQRPVKTGLQTNIIILTINIDGYPTLEHGFYRKDNKNRKSKWLEAGFTRRC
jgi:hypothetical protein